MDNYGSNQPDMPMKWHKFLIYFSLWVGALVCLASGIQLLTGAHYGGSSNAARVYASYGGLKSVDVVFGILYIAIAVFMVFTRFQLAQFRDGAPGKLTAVYVLQMVVFLAYALAASGIVKMPVSQLLSSQAISSIISSVVMIIVNRIYYNKRSHLFVN